MSRQYSPKTFLRSAPKELLRIYLDRNGLEGNIDWDSVSERKIDSISQAIENADERIRASIDRDFRDINDLATEGGRKVIIDESDWHGLNLAESLGAMEDHLDAAMYVFLNHPDVFEVASRFNFSDNLPNRSWRKRFDIPCDNIATDEAAKKRLGAAISANYRQTEGRGQKCEVDHYERGSKLYWFAYPEDYATASLEYDSIIGLDRRVSRPAFELIYVLDRDFGTLEIYVQGDKNKVRNLQEIWGRAILNTELGEDVKTSITLDLNPLKDRRFPLKIDVSSIVESVRIRKMRFSIIGAERKRITLETGPDDDIYNLIDDFLIGNKIFKDILNVTQVGFQFKFIDTGRRGAKTLSFDVSWPNSCSLKHEPKHDIARDHLIAWGIDVTGSVIPAIREN